GVWQPAASPRPACSGASEPRPSLPLHPRPKPAGDAPDPTKPAPKQPVAGRVGAGLGDWIPRHGLERVGVDVHGAHHAPGRIIREINCYDRYDQIFFGVTMTLQLAHPVALQAVARHGSFSRAARELRLTQPAVSMQVRQLARVLGLPLLERVGKRAFT